MEHAKNSEADLQFSLAWALKQELGKNFYLDKFMGETQYGRAFVDVLVTDKLNTPELIIELKMNSKIPSGECDCNNVKLAQYKKYCTFGIPIYTCNGYDDLEATLEYVKDNCSKD